MGTPSASKPATSTPCCSTSQPDADQHLAAPALSAARQAAQQHHQPDCRRRGRRAHQAQGLQQRQQVCRIRPHGPEDHQAPASAPGGGATQGVGAGLAHERPDAEAGPRSSGCSTRTCPRPTTAPRSNRSATTCTT
jgi:hypothetical protein